jgi:hypothetical protein
MPLQPLVMSWSKVFPIVTVPVTPADLSWPTTSPAPPATVMAVVSAEVSSLPLLLSALPLTEALAR